MFREALQDLKDRSSTAFACFTCSPESPWMQICCRDADQARCKGLLETFCQAGRSTPRTSGPESMIMSCKDALVEAGMAERCEI